MRQDRLGNLVADAHDRVECGHRLLKDHGNARAAQLTERFGGESREMCGMGLAGLKGDISGDGGGRGKQAHDGERGDGFSGAGFADQAKDFSGGDAEAEIADGGYGGRSLRLLGGQSLP